MFEAQAFKLYLFCLLRSDLISCYLQFQFGSLVGFTDYYANAGPSWFKQLVSKMDNRTEL